ncbi:MAG TPA: hypothetical protein DCG57_16515 [Candidatus Riflebacteria bacterium]|nr:hypothetical protein [Candidatus Riflebacteria bacterium]
MGECLMTNIAAPLSSAGVSLKAVELSFSRDRLAVIRELSHEFSAGQVTLLTGPSGCGKTTLLRLLTGLETPAAGEIKANGVLWSSAHQILPPWQRDLDMLFQGDALWPNQTVAEQIKWVQSRKHKVPAVLDIGEIIECLGIKDLLSRHPVGLSGGEARRCQLARVLAGNPSLLLLDEPLSGQDAETAAKTAHMLGRLLAKANTTAIVVSHETAPFTDFAWQVVHMPDINAKPHA